MNGLNIFDAEDNLVGGLDFERVEGYTETNRGDTKVLFNSGSILVFPVTLKQFVLCIVNKWGHNIE